MADSSSSSSEGCPPFEYHPRGRVGIGVTQPSSGTDYPFVAPSEDVRYLLADFYLSYEQHDFVLPFRIAYLYGLGCLPGVPDGIPEFTPSPGVDNNPVEHTVDVVVVDAEDTIVFDSRRVGALFAGLEPIGGFAERAWGPRHHIYEWRSENSYQASEAFVTAYAVCRLVVHTHWPPDDDPVPVDYPLHLVPENGVLDPRTLVEVPRRVTSLNVALSRAAFAGVELLPGYNIAITHVDTVATPGGRFRQQVRFDCVPGAGSGIFPGCEETVLTVRRVNGVTPTEAGDFHLAATGCYHVRQPTTIVSEEPRLSYPSVLLSPGNVVDEDLPAATAGESIAAAGWPPETGYGHLECGNDCGPCCPCDEYVAVAQYLNRVRDDYQALGIETETIRDLYHDARTRFLDTQACMHRRPLRIFLRPQICPFLDIAMQFCNQSDQCVEDVDLNIHFECTPAGTADEVPGFTFITGATTKPGRRSPATELYSMAGSWPDFSAHWDSIEPYASVSVRFRLEFNSCSTPYVVTSEVTGTVGGDPIEVPSFADPLVLEEALATETQTLRCPATSDDVKDLTGCVP